VPQNWDKDSFERTRNNQRKSQQQVNPLLKKAVLMLGMVVAALLIATLFGA
jgi:hypothetical protein